MSAAPAQVEARHVAGAPAERTVREMFDQIAPRYDAANRAMSMGVDLMWRRRAIRQLLAGLGERPRLLDLGAGTLDGALAIAARAPGASIAAADFAREMLRVGASKLESADLRERVRLQVADGHDLPYRTGSFDGAFSAFCVRNLPDLPRAMRELRRVIRPGGRLVVLEFFRPTKARVFLDGVWNARILPLVGWAVTGDREAYRYLPASIATFRSGDEYAALLREVGFSEVVVRPLFPRGVASLVTAS